MDRRARLVLPILALAAIGVGFVVTSNVDTGPEVGDRAKAKVRTFTSLPAADAPEEAAARPQGIVQRAPGDLPMMDPRQRMLMPGAGDFAKGVAAAGSRVMEPGGAMGAAATTTGRRITMMQNLFRSAARSVPPGPDQDAVQRVLDDAVGKMRALEDAVANGDSTYRDAVDEMNRLRDAAGEAVDAMLPPDQAQGVKMRMGIRDTPPAEDVQELDWGAGQPVDNVFGTAE